MGKVSHVVYEKIIIGALAGLAEWIVSACILKSPRFYSGQGLILRLWLQVGSPVRGV